MTRVAPEKQWVAVTGDILHETAKAISLEIEGKIYWFPFSRVRKIFRSKDGSQQDYIECESWLLKDKDIDEDHYTIIQ